MESIPNMYKNESVCNLNGNVVMAKDLCECERVGGGEIDWTVSSEPVLVFYYVFLGLLGVLVVLTNLAVILGIYRDSKIHQLHNLLVAGQAVSDLAVGLLVVIFNLGTLFNGGKLVGEAGGCAVYGYGIVVTCHSTVFSLALIAYSRKLRILDNQQLTVRKAALYYFAFVWGLSFLLLIFYICATSAQMACSGAFCNPIWTLPVIIVCAIALGGPIIYTVRVYSRIHRRVDESMRAVQENVQPYTAHEMHQHHKTTQLMVLMSASILVLWTPLYIYFLFTMIKLATGIHFSGFVAVERLLGVAAVSSSLCSPLIYAFKNKSLKLAMMYAFLPLHYKRSAALRVKQRAVQKMQERSSRKPDESQIGGIAERAKGLAYFVSSLCCIGFWRMAWTSAGTDSSITDHYPSQQSSSSINLPPKSCKPFDGKASYLHESVPLSGADSADQYQTDKSSTNDPESIICHNFRYDQSSRSSSSFNTTSIIVD